MLELTKRVIKAVAAEHVTIQRKVRKGAAALNPTNN
jgi:hypothetical protein